MKRYTVIFTPRAERQFSDLYTYISDNSSEARAEKFVSAIVDDSAVAGLVRRVVRGA